MTLATPSLLEAENLDHVENYLENMMELISLCKDEDDWDDVDDDTDMYWHDDSKN